VAQQQPTLDRYREIQQALADRGYFHGTADGAWGTESVDALKRFQADQNLDADGKIGALSLIALGLGPKRESAAVRPAPSSNPISAPTTPEPAPADPAAIAVPAPAPGSAILP
jgi:peptidoglycan hydrolase-like protein with peptidoglycan-binding domain